MTFANTLGPETLAVWIVLQLEIKVITLRAFNVNISSSWLFFPLIFFNLLSVTCKSKAEFWDVAFLTFSSVAVVF